MRNDQFTLLWVLWGTWAILLITYLSPHFSLVNWVQLATLWVAICSTVAIYFRPRTKRVIMFKAKKKADVFDSSKNDTSPPMAELAQVKEERTVKETLIAKGTILTGEISNDSDVLIEGSVIGDIHSSRSIRIGREGRVQGTLTAEKITINGYLQGRCQATAVKILCQGRLDGDIHASELSIDRGGIFNGNSQYSVEKATKDVEKATKENVTALPKLVAGSLNAQQ
ncbi:polymer-forming cytoskeletal protein [Rosenbergiella sp. S61]|uniref:Polymer-forming cytoskeletal protein n=1 Tax=Rosenbergiella gaditana TaxID=2726987 RepID=A0ABS5SZG5_9GAMM|nr:polymer-forming cytoskeletal protein [Rosenbergiella gaditana]MBT0725494.1 polymer-forming cytoskeletal protein [Rosenbergiella gaditana]